MMNKRLLCLLYSIGQKLPGGWYAVVMEKLDGEHIIDTDSISDRVKLSLKRAIYLITRKTMTLCMITIKTLSL